MGVPLPKLFAERCDQRRAKMLVTRLELGEERVGRFRPKPQGKLAGDQLLLTFAIGGEPRK